MENMNNNFPQLCVLIKIINNKNKLGSQKNYIIKDQLQNKTNKKIQNKQYM